MLLTVVSLYMVTNNGDGGKSIFLNYVHNYKLMVNVSTIVNVFHIATLFKGIPINLDCFILY